MPTLRGQHQFLIAGELFYFYGVENSSPLAGIGAAIFQLYVA